jgi:hypothetical protein
MKRKPSNENLTTAQESGDDNPTSTSDKTHKTELPSDMDPESFPLNWPPLTNVGPSRNGGTAKHVFSIQSKETLFDLVDRPSETSYDEFSLEKLCIDDKVVESIWKLKPKRLRLMQCTFQADSRIQKTYTFLKHYQTNPYQLEFLTRIEGHTIHCMLVSDQKTPFPGSFDSIKTLLVILPGRIPEDVSLAHLSCVIIQRSGLEAVGQELHGKSRDSLMFLLDHKFREMGHLILKDLYIDHQIWERIRELDCELTHIYNCHYLSAPSQNGGFNLGPFGSSRSLVSFINESWFILSNNLPPEIYYSEAVALTIRANRKDCFAPISVTSNQTLSSILSRKSSPRLTKVELQKFDLSSLAPLIEASSERQLFLKDYTLSSRFLLSVLCISNDRPLSDGILKFLEESQKTIRDMTPILFLLDRQTGSTHSVDSIILALPKTIPIEYDLCRLNCLILRSSRGYSFDERRSHSGLDKIFPSIYGKTGQLRSIMLEEFLVDQYLIELIRSDSLELLRLENCRFQTDTPLNLSSLSNLERLQITQLTGQKVTIYPPQRVEHLEMTCLGSKTPTSSLSKIPDQLCLDAFSCTHLKSM